MLGVRCVLFAGVCCSSVFFVARCLSSVGCLVDYCLLFAFPGDDCNVWFGA